MNKKQFLKNISRIHELFQENEKHLHSLSQGISQDSPQRDILDNLLENL